MIKTLIASFLFLAILAATCATLLILTNGKESTTTTTPTTAIDGNDLDGSSYEESNTSTSSSSDNTSLTVTTNVPIATTVPTPSPSYSAITSLLLSVSHPDDLLLDLSSPQHAAMTWMVTNDDDDVTQMTDDEIIQRYIAIVVYFSMGGETWTEQAGFLSSDGECQWNDGDSLGVFCNDDGVVNRIVLDSNNLKGVLPSEMGHLAMLHHLSLSNNYISGTIAPQLGNLTKLTTLDLSINELVGTLPEQMGELINLEYLYLFENQIDGTIPVELGRLDSIITLDLHKNNLSGTIPLELGSFSYWIYSPLSRLYLFDNKLSGMIPDEIKNLNQLTDLKIHLNDVTGDINDLCGSGMTLSADCLGTVPDVSCDCCVYCCGVMHDVEICEHQ